MRWTRTFIPTLREAPADAVGEGGRWLARAGFLRERAGGGRVWLPMGQRSLARIEAAAREGLVTAGGEEVRAGSIRSLLAAAGEIRSYRQLPRLWFSVIDGKVFGAALGGFAPDLDAVARRWGVPTDAAVASGAREIVARRDGDRELLRCDSCAALAPADLASSAATSVEMDDPEGDLRPEAFHTPGQKTIAEIAAFTGLPESRQMKSVVVVADGKTVLGLVRGDDQVSEAKLRRALAAEEIRPARAEEIFDAFGASGGSLGPIGARGRIVMDTALSGRRNMICGANRDDYHLRNVTPGEDFQAEVVDIRQARAGDRCASCGGTLSPERAMVLARAEPVRGSTIRVTDQDGRESSPAVVEFEIFVENVLLAAATIHNDKDGMILPRTMAPVDAIITPVSADASQLDAADRIASLCAGVGIECLVDDRDERPGVKFKDADLIGAPYRVTIGKKLPQGLVELVERRSRASEDVAIDNIASTLKERL